ncbi:hypothetical protein [Streptomyces chartreusis]|uniref:hypothetical protein n=1 Tax=Streptomyces chartreusis TaxID=1969 RepID=UPI00142F0D2E|nr:hypothetical protein [Streptomyces chartreusis]GGW99072.1 hypothetical protein GCM10010321_11930 [Streptomyces chartreusis]
MTCLTGKRPYPSKQAARTAIASANRRRDPRRQRREHRAYHCASCNAWHLTSN